MMRVAVRAAPGNDGDGADAAVDDDAAFDAEYYDGDGAGPVDDDDGELGGGFGSWSGGRVRDRSTGATYYTDRAYSRFIVASTPLDADRMHLLLRLRCADHRTASIASWPPKSALSLTHEAPTDESSSLIDQQAEAERSAISVRSRWSHGARHLLKYLLPCMVAAPLAWDEGGESGGDLRPGPPRLVA